MTDMNGDVTMAPPSPERVELCSRVPDAFDVRHTNITPYPSPSPREDGSASSSSTEGQMRTVRKKKSSLHLRDIYRNGGRIPTSANL